MDFINLINEMIPGYASLPIDVRETFEATDDGGEIIQIARQLEQNLARDENTRVLKKLYRMAFKTPEALTREEYIESAKAHLRYCMRSSKAYQDILHQTRKLKFISMLHKWMLKRSTVIYADLLQTGSQIHIKIMNFEHFNATHAKILARNTLHLDEWIELYEASLKRHIKDNILHINGKEPFPNPPLLTRDGVRESVSRLYSYLCSVRKKDKDVKWCVDSINKAADAHAFLQATGFATQNETSWLAGFDIINYFRMAGDIAEVKSILMKFVQPFTPIFIEYSRINQEQNIVRQILRTVIPMLIVATAVVLVSAVLSSFVIPEMAFLFILIPTVYLGLVAASSYIVTKDLIINTLRQQWFGGQFKIPEYQVNDAMTKSFGNQEKAQKVRDFYVAEISECFTTEKQYNSQTKLSQADMDSRLKNAERKHELQLEWYDIHSNPNISTDETLEIALNRLKLDGRKAYDSIQKSLPNELEEEIPTFVHDLADQVRASVERSQIRPKVSETQQPLFFTRPPCFKHREELERLHSLKEEVGMACNI